MAEQVSIEGSSPRYRVISADSHVNEPPDLWLNRVPREFRDRAPHMEHLADGDGWIIEGAEAPINFGFNVCAGQRSADRRSWVRWDDVRESLKSPKGRVADQDEDGVDAEALFPTPRLFEGVVTAQGEDFHLALIRAYNDWLSEFCSQFPDRLLGLAALPNCGVQPALDELDRVLAGPAIRGVVMGQYPSGGLDLHPDNDPVWEALEEAGVPVHIHVKLTNRPPGGHPGPLGRTSKLQADPRFFDVPERILQFIGAEVFDRFPGLKVVFAEADCGWVPYFKEQLLDRQTRHSFSYTPPQPVLDYFRHFYFTFITDHVAIRERHVIGIDQMLWSTDYPHTGSDWPFSGRSIAADFSAVPEEERDRICAGNAVKLYGLA